MSSPSTSQPPFLARPGAPRSPTPCSNADPLALRVRHWIRSRGLAPGDPLPSERALAQALHVERSALHRAIIYLRGSGELLKDQRITRVGQLALPAAEPDPPPPSRRLLLSLTWRAASQAALRWGFEPCLLPDTPAPALRARLAQAISDGISGALLWPPARCDINAEAKHLDRAHIPYLVCEVEGPWNSVSTEVDAGVQIALETLLELGHREFAYLTYEPAFSSVYWRRDRAFPEVCIRMGLHSSAARIIRVEGHLPSQLLHVPDALDGATALICPTIALGMPLMKMAPPLLNIPGDCSLIALDGFHDSNPAALGLTAVGAHAEVFSQTAVDLLCAQIDLYERTGHIPTPERLRLVPRLALRQSVAPPGRTPPRKPRSPSQVLVAAPPRIESYETILEHHKSHVAATWNTPFPRLAGHDVHARCEPLDLAPYLNRSMFRPKGWLGGEPLQPVSPGLKAIHGVTFRWEDEKRHSGFGAVALRSQKVRTSAQQDLPHRIVIPLEKPADALYFLHACAWLDGRAPFAWYHIAMDDGSTVTVPLIGYGTGAPTLAQDAAWRRESTIQDWWVGLPQFDNDHARHLILAHPDDPLGNLSCLYTLEWVNPQPATPIHSIILESDPKRMTSLIVVGITRLIPEPTSHAAP